MIETVLEPSAGTGNLVKAVADKFSVSSTYHDTVEVDCIEIDPQLRIALLNLFGEEYKDNISRRLTELDKKQTYDWSTRTRAKLSDVEALEETLLKIERRSLNSVNVRAVHDDFLTFDSRKHYDLIVMNPPFANGDAHLLKALSLAEPYGGTIRCLLNAETLRNPCTNRRMALVHKLTELDAEISYLTEAFMDADRKTDVEVALIKIAVPQPKYENDPQSLFNQMKVASHIEEPECEPTDLAVHDFLQQIIARFNLEVDAGLRLIREYRAMRPYILSSVKKDAYCNYPILKLSVGDNTIMSASCNKYVEMVRRKYWEALFSNEQFVGKLTSNLREKYMGIVSEMKHYDFTMFNIQKVLLEMNAEMSQGVVDTILSLFETLTVKHTWYPECEKNVHYYSGWKHNKAHFINKKVIIPCYGLFYDWKSNEAFRVHDAHKLLTDIEKALNYLDGNMSAEVNLFKTLAHAAAMGQTKNISCKFFDVTFYKKGTVHIKFTNQELIDRFNIFCARQKAWLPPCYGQTHYNDLTEEEKAVVDSFHGDDTTGSGEKAYEQVVAKAAYYLAPPNQETVMLPGCVA
jgi:hypothetical protein